MLDWNTLFSYNPKEPMLFSSYVFLFILSIAYGIFVIIYKKPKLRNIFLFGFSLFFYYKCGGYYFWLLILSTFIDYGCSNVIYGSKDKIVKKLFLILSLLANIGLLAMFKYSAYFVELINQFGGFHLRAINVFSFIGNNFFGSSYDIYTILLPVGISFYTFQTLSYTIDIYRGNLKPAKNIIDFGFFVTFFPQLVAGPIVRAKDFFPQMEEKFHLTRKMFGTAIFLIMVGFFKKVVVSDYISVNFTDNIFADPLKYSGFSNLMAIYGYAVQIYCDFSGYSDMAIGIAALFGFTLPLNFNSPYKSQSITEFWKRWHISLSSWLRDYLYISLGGNRKGKIRTYINLMLTMLIGGLWHGAATRFIIWGGLHGAALAVHRVWEENRSKGYISLGIFGLAITGLFLSQSWCSAPQFWIISLTIVLLTFLGFIVTRNKEVEKSKSVWSRFFSIVITFHFVCFCWVFFRADSMEAIGRMFHQISTQFSGREQFSFVDLSRRIVEYSKPLAMIVFGLIIHFLPKNWKDAMRNNYIIWPDVVKSLAFAILIIITYQFRSADIVPFVYFDF